ncbi:MAG: hypothetical protein NVS1B5_08720 [Gemmatimonadaceae bacterium]
MLIAKLGLIAATSFAVKVWISPAMELPADVAISDEVVAALMELGPGSDRADGEVRESEEQAAAPMARAATAASCLYGSGRVIRFIMPPYGFKAGIGESRRRVYVSKTRVARRTLTCF